MLTGISQIVVVVLGIVICVLSVWGIVAPNRLVDLVKSVAIHESGIYVAVLVRVLMGAALLMTAATSKFPLAFQIIGLIAIIAAVALVFMGRGGMRKLVAWFDRFPAVLIRVWLIAGLGFGAFLVYGVA